MTIRDLVEQSLQEINAAQSGQAVQPDVFNQGLLYLNMILDHLNATDQKLYADLFSTYVIPTTGNPITIGPTGTWAYPIARPNAIPAASIILTSTPTPRPYVPLTPMTAQQWQNLSTPTLESSLPNRFFYNPTIPNGEFYFWTVENTAYSVQIQTRQMLSAVLANTTFAQAPGYWYALMMLLAAKLSSPLRKPFLPRQEKELTDAVNAAFGNNSPDLRLSLLDWGMPSAQQSSSGIQDFNYLNGQLQ
jgi:hypothetical protein